MITYKYDVDKDFVLILYTGDIYVEDVIDNINRIFSTIKLPRNLLVLEDAREANYHIDIDDNGKIREAIAQYIENIESLKIAFIQNKPMETTINLDYEYDMPFRNMRYKVFSTKEAACQWLGIY